MITIGKYKLIIVKRKEPARLNKKVEKHRFNITLLIFILLVILFSILCFLLVPPTYGTYWY